MSGLIMREAHFPGRAPIDAYGNGGFRFADMSHKGHLLTAPSGIYGWQPADADSLAISDFARILEESAQIQVLLVGTGKVLRPLGKLLREAFREAGITAEPMATGAAVRTFNVLLAEDRAVAAAFLAVD
ncbi:MAG: Mth938-like domain-containing protein [Rhizobiaceae bacterium]